MRRFFAITTALALLLLLGSTAQAALVGVDVGTAGVDPLLPGSFTDNGGGSYTINGGGHDIWDAADGFYYVYEDQMLKGNGELTVHVTDIQNTNDWAKAGVMIRNNLTPGSVHSYMASTRANGSSFQGRTAADTAYGYQSPDGVNWLLAGTETIPMAGDAEGKVYAGMAVTSHNTAVVCTAQFESYSFKQFNTKVWANSANGSWDTGVWSPAGAPTAEDETSIATYNVTAGNGGVARSL